MNHANTTRIPVEHVRPLLTLTPTIVNRSSECAVWGYTTTLTAEVVSEVITEVLSWGDSPLEDRLDETDTGDIAHVRAYAFQLADGFSRFSGNHAEVFDTVYDQFFDVSNDAAVAVARARTAVQGGPFREYLDRCGLYVGRVILLDSVEVAPKWRGLGIGRRLAAQTLHAAGSYDGAALILAIAGSKPEGDREATHARARHLLDELGLEEFPGGFFAGLCGMARPSISIENLLHE